MATVKIEKFGGIAPRQHPTQLADGMAITAMNVVLETGKLVPLREPQLVKGPNILMENGLADIADAKSMHVWRKADGGFDFLLFPGVTWSALGNVAADDLTRIVVSGATGKGESGNSPVVYMRDPDAGRVAYPIAKEPIGYPVVSRAAGPIDPTEANIRYTRFFYTWVDKYGMESPVSSPSRNAGTPPVDDDLQYLDGDSIQFAPVGTANFPASAQAIRVYKVVTGTDEGRIQFVTEKSRDELLEGAVGFTDGTKDEDAGEVMPEIENPPAGLSCIHDVPGSFYCGFAPSAPKTVCFSDVDLLYSWPIAYRYDVADNIVALAVTSNSVFALTDGWPYVLSGTEPESMTVSKLASPAACVSARGVTVLRNTVFYASNAGLMAIANSATEGTVVTNITEQIFTKDQWQELNPKSCLLGHHKGRLFMYFTKEDGSHVGLTFNFADGLSVAVTAHDEAAKCLVVDNAEDKMYFVREGV